MPLCPLPGSLQGHLFQHFYDHGYTCGRMRRAVQDVVFWGSAAEVAAHAAGLPLHDDIFCSYTKV